MANRFIEDLKSLEEEDVVIERRTGKKIKGVCTSIDYVNKYFFIETKDEIKLVMDAVEVSSKEKDNEDDDDEEFDLEGED